MTWYSAHLVFYVKLKNRPQKRFPLWENIVLISAKSEEEAFAKAEKRAWNDPCMQPDDSFTWGGHRAEWVFAGVRKLTLCQDEDRRPADGTELTYIEMEVRSFEALQKLIAGEPVSMTLANAFPDEDAGSETENHTNQRKPHDSSRSLT